MPPHLSRHPLQGSAGVEGYVGGISLVMPVREFRAVVQHSGHYSQPAARLQQGAEHGKDFHRVPDVFDRFGAGYEVVAPGKRPGIGEEVQVVLLHAETVLFASFGQERGRGRSRSPGHIRPLEQHQVSVYSTAWTGRPCNRHPSGSLSCIR